MIHFSRKDQKWVPLPVVITEPGTYLTRGGERVTVEAIATRGCFAAVGRYGNGVFERWDVSGRIFSGQETQNDIVARAPMTNDEAREVFNQAIANVSDPDRVARLEIAREYFTNPEFRKGLAETVWQINAAK